jgi:PAS domain S-box-containing protein
MKVTTSREELAKQIKELEAKVAANQKPDDAQDQCVLFYNLCIESAPFGIMVYDKTGTIFVFNSQLERISGYRKKEIPDVKTWIEKLYPDEEYRKLVIEERKKADSEKKLREREAIITTKGGEKCLCRFSSLLLDTGIRIVFIKDVAEQRMAEELLQESEERFRLLSEAAIEAIIIHKDGVLLKANNQFFKMFGYKPKELLGIQVVPRVIANGSIEFVKKQIESKASTPYEAMGRRKDGDRFPILCHAKMIKYQGSEVRVVSISDLSYQKEAERALRESEERFREMAQHIREVFWLFDWISQKVIYVSPAYEEIWGRSVEDLHERYEEWGESIYPDDLTYAEESFAKIAQSGGGEIREYRIVRPDGTIRWISDKGFAINDENGNVYRIAGIAADITERKLAQQALQESEEKFRTVAEQSPNMIFINKGGKIVYVNQKCEEMMGYKRDEFYSPEFDFLTLIEPESIETVRSSFKKHSTGQEVEPYEYSIVNKKGKRIEVINTTKLINYEGARSILGIVTDITDRKKAENALKEKDKELEQQAQHLEEVNTALKVLLEHREQEKQELEENLLGNIKKLVFPYLEKLDKGKLGVENQTYLNIIKTNLNDLISPLANRLSSNYLALTPTELQITDFIKHGKTSKEIADLPPILSVIIPVFYWYYSVNLLVLNPIDFSDNLS